MNLYSEPTAEFLISINRDSIGGVLTHSADSEAGIREPSMAILVPHCKSNDSNVRRVLLAEDDDELRVLMADALRRIGCVVTEVCNGLQLRNQLEPTEKSAMRCDFDLVISDIRMPRLTGFDAIAGLSQEACIPPLILITAFGDSEAYRRAARLGALAFFDKPFEIERLCDFVRSAFMTGFEPHLFPDQ